jgi:CRP/FNR family nitrogen fixation transcriptional regulator
LFVQLALGGRRKRVAPAQKPAIGRNCGLTIETVSRTLTTLEIDGAIELPTSRCAMLRKRAALARLDA